MEILQRWFRMRLKPFTSSIRGHDPYTNVSLRQACASELAASLRWTWGELAVNLGWARGKPWLAEINYLICIFGAGKLATSLLQAWAASLLQAWTFFCKGSVWAAVDSVTVSTCSCSCKDMGKKEHKLGMQLGPWVVKRAVWNYSHAGSLRALHTWLKGLHHKPTLVNLRLVHSKVMKQ